MKVVIDMPVSDKFIRQLKTIPHLELVLIDKPAETERLLPSNIIRDCNLFFTTFLPLNHTEMTELKFVQISSSGYKQLCGKQLPERNVIACNALGVFDVPIAEWSISMMINLTRDIKKLLHNQDAAIWERSSRFQNEIRGKVVGIWGYGGIGRETARLAKAFGMQVHILTRAGISARANTYVVSGTGDILGNYPDKVFTEEAKEEFLRGIDFLILAMPHTRDTEGIIGEKELKLLNHDAFILNPARGPLIHEHALLKALTENWIAGAALDTHYYYPMPDDHPLWKMPNVIMTPHISGSSANPKFLDRVWEIFVINVKNFIEGKPVLNQLHQESLK